MKKYIFILKGRVELQSSLYFKHEVNTSSKDRKTIKKRLSLLWVLRFESNFTYLGICKEDILKKQVIYLFLFYLFSEELIVEDGKGLRRMAVLLLELFAML